MTIDFTLLKGDYSIYRLKNDSAIPAWVTDSSFYSMTSTIDELTIVCNTVKITLDEDIKVDKHWRILKIIGPLDLSLVGIIATISNTLKENKIPIFVVSTFDTDYILIKNHDLDMTMIALSNAGHKILIEK
jgi:hypothetical protein